MTAKEIFELRKKGLKEEAYNEARQLYGTDKSPYASAAMFWTAVDIFRSRAKEGRADEAEKILLALERLYPNISDKEGWASEAMAKCRITLEKEKRRHNRVEEGHVNILMGTWGEELASAYLREKGFVILERDWHSGHRDIDIVAQKEDQIVFVEVKTRCNKDYGSPIASVNYKKQKNLCYAINHYLKYRHIENPWRFDVIAVIGTPGQEYEIEHIEGFRLDYRR